MKEKVPPAQDRLHLLLGLTEKKVLKIQNESSRTKGSSWGEEAKLSTKSSTVLWREGNYHH